MIRNIIIQNRYLDIAVFILTLSIYLFTISPVANLWDCGEFVVCASRLEIGHPSGAPLYWLLGRIATAIGSLFGSEALACNILSALATATSMMFLCKICRFVLYFCFKSIDSFVINSVAALAALIFAVTDSVWYSAVESEVYALSLCLFSFSIWCALKFVAESNNRKIGAIRWLYLSIFVVGLSLGVHQANLLVLPIIAIAISYSIGRRGWLSLLLSFLIGCSAIVIVQFFFFQGIIELASLFELIFVNNIGLPFHSGLLFTYIGLVLIFGFGAYRTRKLGGLRHLCITSLFILLITYSVYSIIPIRANARVEINLCQPSDVFELKSYLSRNMYGQKAFFYGPCYNAQPNDVVYETQWHKDISSGSGYYSEFVITDVCYPDEQLVFFPRMKSPQPIHREGYRIWTGVNPDATDPPTLWQEFLFTMRYQIGFMYFRYFMWNFAGRQNDIQGNGNLTDGNWICGLPFIDNRLGQRVFLHPDEVSTRGRTMYFLIPFLLGLLGVIYIGVRTGHRKLGFVLIMMFMLTGPLLAFYLNQDPFEPRERDYVYLFSFMIFVIFIAIGILTIIDYINRRYSSCTKMAIATFVALPIFVAYQNWLSHNRVGRTFDVDMARSYLDCCAPNAILFTNADNDTYPLWYLQEVENYRRDVLIVNFGLLGAEWYVAQVFSSHEGKYPLKSKIDWCSNPYSPICRTLYIGNDTTNAILVDSLIDDIANNKTLVNHVANKAQYFNYIVNRKIAFHAIDTICYGLIADNALSIREIALLDILSSNSERPIYSTDSQQTFSCIGLNKNTINQGLVCRMRNRADVNDRPLSEIFLDNISLPSAAFYYQNYDIISAFNMMHYRQMTNEAAVEAINIGNIEAARDVLHKSLSELPIVNYPDDIHCITIGILLFEVHELEYCREVMRCLSQYYIDLLRYYTALSVDNAELAEVGLERIKDYGAALMQALHQTQNDDLRQTIENFE